MSIPGSGRFVLFADLRPEHVGSSRDDGGADRTMVALAIKEYPTIEWGIPEHLAERPAQDVIAADLGEGTEMLGYCVVELDTNADAIDDWYPGDLDKSKAFLDSYPGATWEPLPSDPEEALSLITERLAKPPDTAASE